MRGFFGRGSAGSGMSGGGGPAGYTVTATGGTIADRMVDATLYRFHTFTTTGTFEIEAVTAADIPLDYLWCPSGGSGARGEIAFAGFGGDGGVVNSALGNFAAVGSTLITFAAAAAPATSDGENGNPGGDITLTGDIAFVISGASGGSVDDEDPAPDDGDAGNDGFDCVAFYGESLVLGGGGGNPGLLTGGAGGGGGGGAGGTSLTAGVAATAGTGGGGGGSLTGRNSGAGGTGIIIFRYPLEAA